MMTVAASSGLVATGWLPLGGVAGVGLAVAVGWQRGPSWAAAVMACCSGLLLAWSLPGGGLGLRGMAVLTFAALALWAVGLGSPYRRWAAVLLLVTMAGVFVTVPDPEWALVLLGAAIPIGVGAVIARWPMGGAGAAGLAWLLAWSVMAGGWARPGAMVGGLACLGVLAVEPLWRLVRGPTGRPACSGVVVVVAGHEAAVLVAGRVAGMHLTVLEAAPATLLALAIALLAVAVAARLVPAPGAGYRVSPQERR